jgi:hypothetical protein
MHLVRHRDYVDPLHYRSAETLESFVAVRPDHDLSGSVRELLRRCADLFLRGETMDIQRHHSQLDSFLRNALVVHNYVMQVSGTDEPPRIVDVFQRLLARAQLDFLWQNDEEERKTPIGKDDIVAPVSSTIVWELTEKLERMERQNVFLLRHLEKNNSSR